MALENCAECGNPFRSQVAWNAYLTNEMVEDLTPEQIGQLIDCLDEAVMIVALDFGIGQ